MASRVLDMTSQYPCSGILETTVRLNSAESELRHI
jgi:hypothetical protein